MYRTPTFKLRDALPWLAWVAVMVLAWWAYHPGLSGGFLFDDFVNLNALGDSGAIDSAPTFWRYITSGTADPTGRPLALLSFLIDARDWPADPAPFLRSNLLLHIFNGTALFLLLRKLGRVLDPADPQNDFAAVLGAGLWLLHPLFVSTTLYVVQREAMLPATFILLGLLAYGHGRVRYQHSNGAHGRVWMLIGLLVGTFLAGLSKANGILMPMLVYTLEVAIFSRADAGLQHSAALWLKRFKMIFLLIPSVVVLAYLLRFTLLWDSHIGYRPWTIGQRALTEPRIVFDYLQLLLVPRSISTGLYNDSYVVSHSLWQPASTLPALLLMLVLLCLAWATRQRAPSLSAALLFFFVGHTLESTVVPLELYFEHRNYLPALLLFWPLARALARARQPLALRALVASGLLLLCALTTWQRATIWGQPQQLAALWASRNPDSSRAQVTAASEEISNGQPKLARERLRPLWQQRPNDLQIALNFVDAACATHGLSDEDRARLNNTLRHADIGTLLVRQWLERALAVAISGRCPGLTLPTVETWLDAAQSNPAINTPLAREKSMPPLLALVALHKQQPDKALDYFNRALAANIGPETAAGQAAELASHGYYIQALKHLDTYEKIKHKATRPPRGMPYLHAKVLEWQDYWPRELALLREKLEAEIVMQTQESGQET